MTNSKPDASALERVLSPARFSTYLAAADHDEDQALELYSWNARISAALMLPIHIAEVSTRNAATEALAAAHGDRWPWDPGFVGSLPNSGRFNPRDHLIRTRGSLPTTGKVVAELRFVFWQKLFTARHDARLWTHRILSVFPTEPVGGQLTSVELRGRVYGDLEIIRQLRNRIAHHEPIFVRDLEDDLTRILDLIELRSPEVASWVLSIDTACDLLELHPLTPVSPAARKLR